MSSVQTYIDTYPAGIDNAGQVIENGDVLYNSLNVASLVTPGQATVQIFDPQSEIGGTRVTGMAAATATRHARSHFTLATIR
ncbi:hypothetical protein [Bradyrhizobium sp. Gha]|uniref:hypothetical protein n=1 Tax=Bradyrhizobium sp. Gha TaxID=1855318 RepID=UPI0008ED2546|nr:hypothetical protein [Bradyrhizobium sp. Gha]SFI08945.1 hypothetical protein SAMN05216525_10445 [Bradyrhizobium sp. Gha]